MDNITSPRSLWRCTFKNLDTDESIIILDESTKFSIDTTSEDIFTVVSKPISDHLADAGYGIKDFDLSWEMSESDQWVFTTTSDYSDFPFDIRVNFMGNVEVPYNFNF